MTKDVDKQGKEVMNRLHNNNSQRFVDFSTRGPGKPSAGQKVKVYMEDRLTGIMSIVDHQPIAS
jgi:hypothetical protein